MTQKNKDTSQVSRHRLLARIDQREQDLREEVRRLRLAAEAAETAVSGVERELIDRHLQEVFEIERARERLAAGAYGTCVECAEPIGHERLRAMPAAKYCTDCQAEREKAAPGPGYPR